MLDVSLIDAEYTFDRYPVVFTFIDISVDMDVDGSSIQFYSMGAESPVFISTDKEELLRR